MKCVKCFAREIEMRWQAYEMREMRRELKKYIYSINKYFFCIQAFQAFHTLANAFQLFTPRMSRISHGLEPAACHVSFEASV